MEPCNRRSRALNAAVTFLAVLAVVAVAPPAADAAPRTRALVVDTRFDRGTAGWRPYRSTLTLVRARSGHAVRVSARKQARFSIYRRAKARAGVVYGARTLVHTRSLERVCLRLRQRSERASIASNRSCTSSRGWQRLHVRLKARKGGSRLIIAVFAPRAARGDRFDVASVRVMGRSRRAGRADGAREYFPTLPPGSALGRDAACAAQVTRSAWEPRPGNATANRTVPNRAVTWSAEANYWTSFRAKRARVTGNFTGTTDEILQWTACKWGLDEALFRAIAFQESSWRQSALGDYCGDGKPRSFGILQVRHAYCDNRLAHGGMPWTQRSTALNVDYAGAVLRACFEGDFYDGGRWLYGGKKVVGDLWGCVGYYYSGGWYDAGATAYVAKIKKTLAARPWVTLWGYPGK